MPAQKGHWRSQKTTIVTGASARPRAGSLPRINCGWSGDCEKTIPVPPIITAAMRPTMRPSFHIFMRVSPIRSLPVGPTDRSSLFSGKRRARYLGAERGSAGEGQRGAAHDTLLIDVPLLVMQE